MKKSGTDIRPCDCKNEFQDKKYGDKKRVWNCGVKHDKCSVCGKIAAK